MASGARKPGPRGGGGEGEGPRERHPCPLDVSAVSLDGEVLVRTRRGTAIQVLRKERGRRRTTDDDDDDVEEEGGEGRERASTSYVVVHEEETRYSLRDVAVFCRRGATESYLVCAATSGGAKVLGLRREGGEWLVVLPEGGGDLLHYTQPMACAAFSGEGRLGLGWYCGIATTWQVDLVPRGLVCSQVGTLRTGSAERIRGMGFSPCDRYLAAVDWLGTVFVFRKEGKGEWEKVAAVAAGLCDEESLSSVVRWAPRGNTFEVSSGGEAGEVRSFHVEGRWVESLEPGFERPASQEESAVVFKDDRCEIVCVQDEAFLRAKRGSGGTEPRGEGFDYSKDNRPVELEVRFPAGGDATGKVFVCLDFCPPRWRVDLRSLDSLPENRETAVFVGACHELGVVLVYACGVYYSAPFAGLPSGPNAWIPEVLVGDEGEEAADQPESRSPPQARTLLGRFLKRKGF
ncbi:hypothetical protein HOP50_09g53880 [Chloropicon primus]|uniref:WD40 repeat domain-containing protein n=2 Tax=Chloropicon primus TaxID=1764295 RepID=A0A5B8MTS2_9CHLO|nr:hypothetical protein A3770_09p53580 [Chloropicon primus]UPR02064.1 hypothetical protein HOP50_09g53880 [Chloropicon primus]|eukprot:QDZ22840.1 hypothetical protein A3770_09p53580 [Chloropicon primus]